MIGSSLSMAYQDFKFRTVGLWSIVLLSLGCGMWSVSTIGFLPMLWSWVTNLAFIGVQFALGALVIGLAKGEWKFFDRYIGWGDVLFLASISIMFCTVNFLVFYCTSLVVVLVLFLIYDKLFGAGETTVPLAGGLSLCVLAFLVILFSLGYSPWEELPLYALY